MSKEKPTKEEIRQLERELDTVYAHGSPVSRRMPNRRYKGHCRIGIIRPIRSCNPRLK